MGIIKNTTDGIHPVPMRDYQQTLFQQLSRGFRKGEMMVISAGRQTGKSFIQKQLLNAMYNGTNLYQEIELPVKEEKYKFSRAKWYSFNMPSPFTTDPISKDMVEWCIAQFGQRPVGNKVDPWSTRWYIDWNTINFRDSQDYEWFMLRWA